MNGDNRNEKLETKKEGLRWLQEGTRKKKKMKMKMVAIIQCF